MFEETLLILLCKIYEETTLVLILVTIAFQTKFVPQNGNPDFLHSIFYLILPELLQ